jgi:hypothetical protein
MSILRFLRVVIAETTGLTGRATGSSGRRKLALESLERRAMLTLVDPLLAEAASVVSAVEAHAEATAESLPVESIVEDAGSTSETEEPSWEPIEGGSSGDTEPDQPPPEPTNTSSSSGTGEEEPPPETTDTGSGSGTGEEEAPTEPTDAGSGTGTGEGEAPPDQTDGGSGTGTGEVAPRVTSLYATQNSGWVAFFGTAVDNASLEGLTVFLTSDLGHQFTATLQEDGSFSTMSFPMQPGTQITAWFIDADGNYSESVTLVV